MKIKNLECAPVRLSERLYFYDERNDRVVSGYVTSVSRKPDHRDDVVTLTDLMTEHRTGLRGRAVATADELFRTALAVKFALERETKKRVEDEKTGIRTVEDLVSTLYEYAKTRADENLADESVLNAARERAKELLGLDLE